MKAEDTKISLIREAAFFFEKPLLCKKNNIGIYNQLQIEEAFRTEPLKGALNIDAHKSMKIILLT